MSLVESRWQRTLTLCALYVAQGVPWGFMLITLPAWLSSEFKLSDSQIGQLKGIILVPWSFKLIWAPLVDSFTIRSMGRRRPWILGAELMMAATLFGFIGLTNPAGELRYILVMYFLHNCFASLQDLCTDALAVDVLPFDEQGRMNGLMWGSKLIGKGVGAWGLAVVLERAGLGACVAVQVGVLLAILIIPLLILERPGERRFPWSRGAAVEVAEPGAGSPAGVFRESLRAFSLSTLLVYLVFVLAHLIGIGVNEVAAQTLYTQFLSPKWTATEFSTVTGLYTTGPIIAGTLLAGLLADRFGRRPILMVGFGGYGLAALAFAAFPALWNTRSVASGYLIACETLYGIGSVGFLSMAMRISWTSAAATVFTTYMTLSNLSHTLGNWVAGPVRTAFKFGLESDAANMRSYSLTFAFAGAVSIAPLLLLRWVRPEQVDHQKQADRQRAEDAGQSGDR